MEYPSSHEVFSGAGEAGDGLKHKEVPKVGEVEDFTDPGIPNQILSLKLVSANPTYAPVSLFLSSAGSARMSQSSSAGMLE